MSFEIPFYENSLKISYTEMGVYEIDFQEKPGLERGPQNVIEKEIAGQITAYLNGQSQRIDFKIDWGRLKGTEFQKKVWKRMSQIPFGKVETYGDLAQSLSARGAARAVGSACGKNPVLLAIPCHRVVGKGGLGGFSGGGLDIKRALHTIEGIQL